jgi:hypothetical protein
MNRLFPSRGCAALLLGAFLLAGPARADWPSTPTAGMPVSVADGRQGPPVMLPDGCGGAYFAWLDYRFGWTDKRFYAQHLCALGNPAYAADGTALTSAAVPDEWPALVPDGTGDGAYAVWRDFRADTAGNLYAQRLARTDSALWGAGGVPVCTGPLHERMLAAAPDGAGGLFVAWTDDRDGPEWQIRAQRVSAYGALLWGEAGLVVGPNPALQVGPRLVPDGEGGVVVAWNDMRGLQPNVFAQRLSGEGVAQWTEGGVLLSTAIHGVYLASLASDGRGGAFAALLDYRSQNTWAQAYAQHVDRTGSLAWASDGFALSGATWPVQQVEVCADDAGGAFFAWRDYENAGIYYVFAAHLDSAGAWPISATLGAGADGSGYGGFVGFALAPDGEGGALLAWNGWDTDAYSIWAQRFDAVLTLAWAEGGVKAAHSAGVNYGVRVVTDHRGGAILGWMDYGSAWSGDLFAARVDATGKPGTAGVPAAIVPARLALSAGPTPARSGATVTLRLAMPAAGDARVTLFDPAGRRVAVLRGAAGAPGTLSLHWDGRDAGGRFVPPGLYFARAESGARAALARLVVTD